jgi:hypothetical protein
MTVRVSKPEFNLREKISELDKPIGFKGNELMRSDTAQDARDLISAGRRNLIINGSMAVAQRATSVSAQSFSTPVTPVCDRWQFRSSNLDQANFDVSQQTDAPKGVCTKSIKVDVNAAETALDANEQFWIAQTIEAQNCSDLGFGDSGASDLTISFYVKSNVTGTYSMYLYSQDPNRSISRTYTIDTSGQWERKIIHIPGDTGGSSINHDNGIGIKIYWHLLAGSDYQSSNATNWQTHNGNATAYGHEVNIASSTSNYWQLTGVQVERGSNATEFENRSFGEEMVLCHRYYQQIEGYSDLIMFGSGRANGVGNAQVAVPLTVPLRASPTIPSLDYKTWGVSGANAVTNGQPTVTRWFEDSSIIHLGFDTSSLDNGRTAVVSCSGGSTLQLDSEL